MDAFMHNWAKKGIEKSAVFRDRVVVCFTTAEASIYAHSKRKIVLQSYFCTVLIGEKNSIYTKYSG